MAKVPTPNYVLTQDFTFACGPQDTKILLKGTFVRPIKLDYVPVHVKEDKRWKYFDPQTETYCYCSYGVIPIPNLYIRIT